MQNSSRLLAAPVALAAAVALLPQRGDPGPDPVTHPDWARMMLRGLGLEEALEFAEPAPRAFAILSWRQSEWLNATQYIPRSDQGVELEPGTPALLRARAVVGEASFPVAVARAGEYRLRARMAGEPSAPATVEVVPLGWGATRTCTLVPVPTRDWIEAPKPLRLHPGVYRATFALPRGTVFEVLELAPRCIAPIEPLGGWQTDDVLDAEDLAVTLIRAVDRERELPPADAPIETAGGDFETEGTPRAPTARLAGGTAGARATVSVEVPVAGLYSLSAFGVSTAGQRWAADDCRTAVTCPLPSTLPTWSVVMTVSLSAGRHRFTVDLGPSDSVDRVRLERRKDAGPDYVDALRRMGFDPGEGAVSRSKADEALSWLRERHWIELNETCFEPAPTLELLEPVPTLERGVALVPAGWELPVGEPPATPPCQPPSSPDVPEPCAGR